jgi:riboflavin kinase / FMN adenylyltransferase
MTKGIVLTIGVFDGFHRGHQSLVRETVRLARRLKASPAALTFKNHPLNVLHHEGKVAFLYPRKETFRALKGAGIGRVLVVDFTARYARQTPEEFVHRWARRFDLKGVVVGDDFRFGSGNRGDVTTLRRLGRKLGFKVSAVTLRGGAGNAVSSSRIRRALLEGRVEEANRMLGRPFHITGRVMRGRHIGHKLGYPTANLERLGCFIPRRGIYACLVKVGNRAYRGGLDLGTQPTVSGGSPSVRAEAHLLGYHGNLYGRNISIHLMKYLRPEIRFKGLGSLARHIRRDVETIRRMKMSINDS